ncbi:hypothetical protein [Paraburkholderia sp. J8-2]|uniref:hypothetical protein n=1 Tax=Paraburkholderia sp. J8-2 TaxID=2805440 RepID=UPI002AB632E1|nr:hypothetical protein [Paraburkholderia sp. J8-2]
MKNKTFAIAALSLALAACGGGSSANGSSTPSATAPATSASAPPAVTVPTVTNTLTQGAGVTWNQGTVNLAVNVKGAQQVTPFVNVDRRIVWTGSALFAMAGFDGSFDKATANALAGTFAYISSVDGKTWQAGTSQLPAAAGSGFVMYPESIASDGKGTLAVYGQAIPVGTSYLDGATAPDEVNAAGSTVTSETLWSSFVAYANANDMSWTVTMLPITSLQGGQISYAYGNWWVQYYPSGTQVSQTARMSSPDLAHWAASTAPSINFLAPFAAKHPYWATTGDSLYYSDDLQSWTSKQPTTANGNVRYVGLPLASSTALVMNAQSIETSTNQEISTTNIIASADGSQWASGGFATFEPQNFGFTCANRFFLWGFIGDGIFFSNDSLNWTNVALPKLQNSSGGVAQYISGGCQANANRAVIFTDNNGVIYSD